MAAVSVISVTEEQNCTLIITPTPPDMFYDTAAEKQARILADSVGITLTEDIKPIKI